MPEHFLDVVLALVNEEELRGNVDGNFHPLARLVLLDVLHLLRGVPLDREVPETDLVVGTGGRHHGSFEGGPLDRSDRALAVVEVRHVLAVADVPAE